MSVQHSISHSLLSLKLTERRTLSPALEFLDAGYDSTEHGVTLEEDMQSPQHNIQMCRCRSPLCGLVVFWLAGHSLISTLNTFPLGHNEARELY